VERTDCVQLLQIRRRLVGSQSSQTFFARRYIVAVLLGPRPPHRELLGKRQIEESIGLGNKIGDDRARHAMPRHGEKADLLAGARNPTRDLEACGGVVPNEFAADSALEGDGFEPSVPRRRPSPPWPLNLLQP